MSSTAFMSSTAYIADGHLCMNQFHFQSESVVALPLRVSVIAGLARSTAYKGVVLPRVSAFLLFVLDILVRIAESYHLRARHNMIEPHSFSSKKPRPFKDPENEP